MTETPSKPAKKAAAKAPSKSAGLSSMLLADLKSMAAGLGIAGAGSMKKAQLVDAIKATQSGGGAKAEQPQAQVPQAEPQAEQPQSQAPQAEQPQAEQPSATDEPAPQTTVRTRTRKQRQVE